MTTTNIHNIQWIIQNCTEENLKKVNLNNRIISPGFHVHVCGSILKWCFEIYYKDGKIQIFLCKESPSIEQDFTIYFKCKIESKEEEHFALFDYKIIEFGYGFSEFMALEDLLVMLRADVNNTKSITLKIQLQFTPKEAEEQKSPIKSNVVRETFAEYLNMEAASDVSFKCSDGVKVHAHQILLMKKSEEFKSILNAMKVQRKKIQEFNDVDSPTLKEVLKHIYTGNANLSDIKFIDKVYPAAVKFDLPELQLQCVDTLSNQLSSVENILDIFKTSVRLELTELEGKALSCILKNFHSLKATPKWQNLGAALKAKVLDACSSHFPEIILKTTL